MASYSQRGGDYISTISSISTMSTIATSTLSAIVAMAGLSNFSNITNLTTEQITTLITSIDRQITFEGTEITRLQGVISNLDTEINVNPNYQKQFTDASGTYWSVAKRYSSLQSTIDATNADIVTKQVNLSSLSTQAGFFLSSFNGYDAIYKQLLSSFQSVNVLLNGQIDVYNTQVNTISTLNSYIGSTIQQRNQTPPAQTALITNLDTSINSLSTARRSAETLASTAMGNISSYIYMSTMQALSTGFFQSNFYYWSTMEAYAISSVNGYTTIRDALITQSGTLDGEIATLRNDLNSKLGTLDQDASNFYTKKKAELLNGVDELSYAMQEYSAGFGVLTSELLIRKLNLDDEIDNISMQIQQANATGQPSGTLINQRSAKSADSNQLQNIVTTLNPIETSFRFMIDNTFPLEKANKENFINTRKELYDIERRVLETPSLRTSIQSEYTTKWGTMQNQVTAINARITDRINMMYTGTNNLSTTIGNVRVSLEAPPLNSYMNGLTIPTIYTGLTFASMNAQSILPQLNDPLARPLSEYALLPPINFDPNALPFPSTIT